MTPEVTLLQLVGGWGDSELERTMRYAHQAAALDLLRLFLGAGLIERAIIATDEGSWTRELAGWPVTVDVDPPGQSFHFGQRLAGLIERYDVRRVLYTGGASGPLMSVEDWAQVVSRLADAVHVVVTNNAHSCDWLGFAVTPDVLRVLSRQSRDNGLAWLLSDDLGLDLWSAPPAAATRLDLDTPADLMMAQNHPAIGPHLCSYLGGLSLDRTRVDGVLGEMAREGGSLALVGRASPAVWEALDRATRCWVRVFAEERGMRASGRQERGEVRSLLAEYVSAIGFDRFFGELARLVNAVLIDDRVLLAAAGRWPLAADRFRSDLYRWEDVQDSYLRALTKAAAQCPVPVVLGGHSVVAGGLLALIEIHEARQRQAPDIGRAVPGTT